MQVEVAEFCGFCYGVKRAVGIAQKAANAGVKGGTLGPLIHNPQLIAELEEKGIACNENLNDFVAGDTVIFRSHGVGPAVYKEAEARGLVIMDATCLNVRLAQKKAADVAAAGYFPIIVGEKNHPEVKSILKWAGKNGIVVEYIEDISNIPKVDRYGVIIQTTFELSKFEKILAAMKEQRPGEYRVERTICLATSQRQKAALDLAKRVDAMVVIGGRNSANTRHLYDLVKVNCGLAYHIETAAELQAGMFENCHKIGITAGASTPDRLIKEAIVVMENMESFEELFNQTEEVEVYPGKVVTGEVISKDKDGVYVGFGYRHDGFIPYNEYAADACYDNVEIGTEVEAKVMQSSTKTDVVRMSKIKAEAEAAWKTVAPLAEGEKRACTVKVNRIIKNKAKSIVGLEVAVEGVNGFMPASHVELKRVEDFAPYVGQEMAAEIIEVDLEKRRIVVSRRDMLKAEREAKHQAYLAAKEERAAKRAAERAEKEERAYASVEEGQIVPGKVVKVADFGLFVEVGEGLVGLVHNTELSWDRAVKAADVAAEGAEVEVLVKKIDKEAKRVALSIKATQEDPWVAEAKELQIGDQMDVEVVRFLPFGAIVKINDKLEGLVHISEIARERIEKPADALEIGQVVKAEVIKMDLDSKKIGMSISKIARDAARAARNAERNAYKPFMNSSSLKNEGLAAQLENLEK